MAINKSQEIIRLIKSGTANAKIVTTLADRGITVSNQYVKNIRHSYLNGKINDLGSVVSEDEKQEMYQLAEDIKARKISGEIKQLKAKNSQLVTAYEELSLLYDKALLLKENTGVSGEIVDLTPHITSTAIPIIQWSDWHVEERIERRTTHGLNEFNPEIAEQRASKLSLNTLKLVEKERQDVKIEEIFICLGGDFFNNYLHEHDVQMNFMSPIEAAIFAKQLLVKSLKTIAENGRFKKIVLMCVRGNHGRLTRRMQSSNDYKMNLEAVIYYMLKQELNDPIFEWHIPESEHGYIKLFDKTIRSFHGHQINYQGGVGDLTIPTNKAIMKWDKTVKADWNLMHHFHSYWMPTRNTSLNGSLCGWNSYALSIGAPYEPPIQTFHLLDSKRGFTVRTPIHCE